MKKKVTKIIKWVTQKTNKIKAYVTYISISIMTLPLTVYANDGTSGWNTVMDFIITWVPRLGGVMLFGGAIEYAIAYQADNPAQKTQASRFMVAGGMVIGIPLALKSLIMI